MRKHIILFLLVLIGFLGTLKAETDNSIELISVSQGLPNAQVTQILMGKSGLMWIGTSNGLCIFDGFNFTVKQSIPFDTSTLADDNIILIAQDRNSNIWLLTHFGIEFIDVGNMTNKRIFYVPDPTEIIDIIPSPLSNYVFVVYKNRIQKINIENLKPEKDPVQPEFKINSAIPSVGFIYVMGSGNISRFNLQNSNIEKLSFETNFPSNVNSGCLNVYDSEHLLFGRGKDLYLYNINSYETNLIATFDSEVTRLTRQHDNKIAIATKNSIFQLTFNEENKVIETNNLHTSNELLVSSLIQDNNNIIFAATNKGIIKINPHSRLFKHRSFSETGISELYLNDIIVESSQRGYLTKSSAGKFVFYDALKAKSYAIDIDKTPTACLLIDNKFFLGTNEGLFLYNLTLGKLIEAGSLLNDMSINSLEQFNENIFVATNKGLFVDEGSGFKKSCNEEIYKFIVTEKEIYFTNKKGFGKIDRKQCQSKLLLNQSNSNEFLKILDLIQSFDGKIWLATEDGLYRFNSQAANEHGEIFSLVYKGKVYSLTEVDNLPEIWFATDIGIGSVNYQTGQLLLLGYEDGIRQASFIDEGVYLGQEGEVNFLSSNEIISFIPCEIFRNKKQPEISISHANFVSKDKSDQKLILPGDTIILGPKIHLLELSFTINDFYSPRHTEFEYCLDENETCENWRPLHGNMLSVAGLSPGTYEIKVKAINSHGVGSSDVKKFVLLVKAPVFESRIAYVIYFVLMALLIFSFIRIRTRNLTRLNREYKDRERIAKKIEQQKEELTLKNKNITDSINYARRIQLAMMPSVKLFKAFFTDSFILHMPKDIVSGDFYWVNHVENKVFLSAVDCTGHGVPGAFMSIIGVELFRRITEIEKTYVPADVLNSLSKNFERVFGDVDEMKLRDGMDLAFCSINEDHTILEFSGAFNPLYIIRDSSIIEVKGDRQSVGVYHDEDEVHSFTNHVIPLQDGDLIYIFTDGFVDQFGGPEGKKYKYRRFRHLLLALQQLPLNKQEEYLRKSILEWKGENDQVDDILVIGLRIHQHKK